MGVTDYTEPPRLFQLHDGRIHRRAYRARFVLGLPGTVRAESSVRLIDNREHPGKRKVYYDRRCKTRIYRGIVFSRIENSGVESRVYLRISRLTELDNMHGISTRVKK